MTGLTAEQMEEEAYRFLNKIDPTGDCWLWNGTRSDAGYGRFRFDGRSHYAHRMMHSAVNGDIPAGMQVLHSCDNPRCVNPAHLSVGTQRENMADKMAKNRQAKGDRHGIAKLTASAVRAIRERCAAGEKQRDVAAAFGVTQSSVSLVASRELWKHIP